MTANTFLKRLVLVGVFAVPFIPLFVSSGMFFPFITGKNFAFRIIVEIILAAWAILAFRDASYRPKKSIILTAFAVFIGVLAVADMSGENPYRSFWSNYERMEGLVALLHMFAYFMVATAVLTGEKLWQRFFYTSFGANIAIVGYSLFQLFGGLTINQGGARVDATFGNATYLAVYMLFSIFLLAFYLIRNKESVADSSKDRTIFLILGSVLGSILAMPANSPASDYFVIILLALVVSLVVFFVDRIKDGRVFLWILLLADLFVLYRTETRGAILGLLGGIVVTAVILAVGNWRNTKVRNAAVGVLLGLTVLAGLFWAFKDTSFVRQNPTLSRFAAISLTEQTTKSRFTIWNMSWQGFKERPILGWGQDNFIVVFGKYYKPEMWSQEPWFDRSHNVFFDWMIAGGLLGILAYLSLFGAGMLSLWKSLKFSFAEKSVLTGLLAGYFFQNLFVFDNLLSYIMFFSVLGFISVAGRENSDTADTAQKQFKDNGAGAKTLIGESGAYLVVPAVLAAFILVLYFGNIKPIMASGNLIQGISGQKDGPAKNLEYFEKVFALNTFGSGEAREQLIQVSLRLKQLSVPDEIKNKFFNLGREQMLLQINQAPTDVRYELYLGSFLSSFGAFDEAINHLSRAVELSPKKQPVLFEIGSAYINKGDMEAGLKYFKDAYDAAPEYPDAVLSYATGLLYAKKDKEAEALLLSAYGTVLVPDNRIISAYVARGMYDKVIAIRKIQLDASPGNQQIMLTLAAAYLNAGQRENAVSELREMIKINPDFKGQGEYLIKEINAGRNP